MGKTNTSMHDLPALRQLFENYQAQHSFQMSPAGLYEPVAYILQLGGKRIRPILLLMGCNLFDDRVEQALPAAYAVEIFHNFSLVHDDIMDDAPLRRGQATVHEKYNINTGILSGDVMLIYAYRYLLQTPDFKDLSRLVAIFNHFATEVCEGQQLDMNFETQARVEADEYLKMIEQKTAALLGGALQMGALIGGGSNQAAELLDNFGRQLGIAFQLQDDILDTFGDPLKFGKKVGGDISRNKKTYLLIKALELAKGVSKSELDKLLTDPSVSESEKIEGVTAIYEHLGVRSAAEDLKQAYTRQAYNCLEQIEVQEERKVPLYRLAEQLVGREE